MTDLGQALRLNWRKCITHPNPQGKDCQWGVCAHKYAGTQTQIQIDRSI